MRHADGTDTPASAGGRRPFTNTLEVIVGEPEPSAHRRRRGQVENLTGRDACVRKVEQGGHDREDRIGLM